MYVVKIAIKILFHKQLTSHKTSLLPPSTISDIIMTIHLPVFYHVIFCSCLYGNQGVCPYSKVKQSSDSQLAYVTMVTVHAYPMIPFTRVRSLATIKC